VTREQRLVFGEDPQLYDRARPGYPSELVDDVVAMAGPSARALDIGCGTGKAALLLAARGLQGVGLEAHPAMAAAARRNLAAYQGWRVDVGDFETWEPAGGARLFDLACCAQAWHWLDPEVRLHKAHRLLKSGGWLTLWWNRRANDGSPLEKDLLRVYNKLAPSLPGGWTGLSDLRVDDIPPGLSFGEPRRRDYPWALDYTADEWVALLRTHSDHRMLPEAQLDELTGAVAQRIRAHGGVLHCRYICRSWAVQKAWTRRPARKSDLACDL
jgi:SAM-dependent methyltransferase